MLSTCKKLLVVGLLLLLGHYSTAQSPGGVSANLDLWLKANTSVEEAASDTAEDGDDVLNWLDQSSSSNDATQSNTSNRPVYQTGEFNFNPVVEFTETNDDRMEFASNLYTGSNLDFTGFYVIAGNDTDFVIANGGSAGVRFYLRHGQATFGTNTVSLPTITNGVMLQRATHSSGTIGVTQDGGTETTGATGTWSSTASTWKLGAYGNPTNGLLNHHFDGKVAEVALYGASLSSTEITRVESYLGIKYGIHLDNSAGGTAGDYVNAAGTTIWDASANSTYHNDITGLARDNTSGIHQRQSRTNNDATGLAIYHGAVGGALPTTNEGNNNGMTDGQYLIVGHDNAVVSFSTAISGGLRMTRVFRAEDVGSVGTVTLYFDNTTYTGLSTGNTYSLITSSDPSFDGSDVTTAMTEDGVTGNYYVEVDLNNAGSTYFTIIDNSTTVTPGGVGNLQVWLRADEGTNCNTGSCSVSAWADASSNGYSYTQGTGADQPTFAENTFNFHPSLNFNGTSMHLDGPDLSQTSNLSILAVVKPDVTSGNRPVFAEVTDASAKQFSLIINGNVVRYDAEISSNNSEVSGTTAVGTTTRLVGTLIDGSLNTSIRLDGDQDATGTIAATPANSAQNSNVGTWPYNSAHFSGDIGEILFYSTELTGTNLLQAESYLAWKYGIHLDNSGGGTAGDYVNSSGTTVWDASTNSTYHNDVFGICRMDAGGLYLRQSRSENSSTGLTLYTGSGYAGTFPSSNAGNFNTLGDNQFLTTGHDNGSVAFGTSFISGTRMTRIYQMADVGGTGTVTLYFDNATFTGLSTGNTYYLVTSADATFDGNDNAIQMTEIGSTGDFYVEVDFNDNTNTWFTLSDVADDGAPGGIATNLNLWYQADDGVLNASSVTAANGEDVGTWNDNSTNANHATQSSGSNRPVYQTGDFNFNPSIQFTEANNDRLDITSDVYTTTGFDFTGFWVFNGENNANIVQNTGFAGARFYLRSGSTHIGTNQIIGPVPSGISMNTGTHSGGTTVNSLNGGNATTSATGTWSSTATSWKVGAYGGAADGNTGHHFEGNIAEIALYNSTLSATEKRQVESYLGIKYGIQLDNGAGGEAGDYVNSSGSTLWDASTNSSYHNEVFGIARDDLSGLHQHQSRSSQDATGLILYRGALGGVFPTTNTSNANNLDNNTAIMVGHDNGAVALGTTLGSANQMTRIYQAVETGTVGTVTLYFDNTTFTGLSTGNTYYLLTSNDASMDVSDIPTAMTEDGGTGNYYVEIDLPDNSTTYFTIVDNPLAIGPGGITSNLSVWLRADAGTSCNTASCDVSSWTDRSTNAFSYSQSTAADQPAFNSAGVNFNPSLTFDGVSEYLSGPSRDAVSNLSIFAVVDQNSTSGRQPIFVEVTDAATKQFSMSTVSGVIRHDAEVSSNNAFVEGTTALGTTQAHIMGSVVDGSQGTTIYVDGASDGTGTLPAVPANSAQNTVVGAWLYSSSFTSADIAEIVFFESEITGTDRQRIESYLALKYGIHLSNSGGGTAGDYINGSNTTIWDASANSTYHNQVVGIGRDDAAGLYQRQSRPAADATGLTVYTGSGYGGTFPTTNSGNSNSLNDNNFVITGHDNGSVALGTVEFGGNRMTRLYQAVDAGNTGTITLYFDNTTFTGLSTGNTYHLWYSSDESFDPLDGSVQMTEDGSTGNFYVEMPLNPNTSTFFTVADVAISSAPGGVSTSLDLWMRADVGVKNSSSADAANGEDVGTWEDRSATGNDATQSNSSNRPVYRTNEFNFNPGIEFTEVNNDRLALTNDVYTTTGFDFTGFWVFNGENNGNILQNGGGPGTRFYLRAGTVQIGTNSVSGSAPSGVSMNTGTHSGGTNGNSLNGEVETTTATGTWSSTSTSWRIGAYGNPTNGTNGHHFEGSIAEVAVYSTTLSATDKRRVESYLGIKYGITLDNGAGAEAGDYVNGSGTTWWDASTNATYHNEVIGIARDDQSGLHQRQTRTANTSTALGVYHGAVGSSLPATNQGNANDLTDNTALLIGHDNGSVALGTSVLTGNRMTRIYRAEDMGGIGTVTLYFDNTTFTGLSTGNTYYFLSSSDATIAIGDNSQVMTEDGTTGNYYIEIDLSNNTTTYFTISDVDLTTAPGAVIANLEVWLKADANTNCNSNGCSVSSWTDASRNAHVYAQGTGGNQPTYTTNAINFNPALTFDGSADHLDGPSLAPVDDNTIIAVVDMGATGTFQPVFAEVTDASDKQFALAVGGTNTARFDGEISGNNSSVAGATALDTEPHLIGSVITGALATSIRYDGAVDGTGTIAATPSNSSEPTTVGTWPYNSTYFNGAIAEVVMYDTALTNAELQRVESYLAVKYGLTLSNDFDGDGILGEAIGSNTEGDYLSSDGTVIWDYSANTTYHNGIVGIGQDDASGYSQSTSNSINSGTILRIENPSDLTNGEFFMVGHNGGEALANEALDVPAAEGVEARLVRVWRVEENNGDVGTVDLVFDDAAFGAVTLSDVRLLIDTDDDGLFNDETSGGGGVISGAVAGSIKFNGINLSDGHRFTLGTVDATNTPLPVELLSFNAILNGDQVDLSWETATEINNDYYVVERSQNGRDWEEVVRQEGAKNSNGLREYFDIDPEPLFGLTYYRLTQFDLNGDRESFNWVPVRYEGEAPKNPDLEVFPNPLPPGQQLHIRFTDLDGQEVVVVLRDLQGREFYSKVVLSARKQELIAVDALDNIPAGTYLVIASSNQAIYSRKLIVQ